MKIQQVNRNGEPAHALGSARHGETADTTPSVIFQRTLTDLVGQARETHLRAMMDAMDEQAKLLKAKSNLSEFVRYKKMVRDFLDDVVSNGYEFNKETTYGKRGRRRYLVTVQTVNEKLDELGREVMLEQADSLKILNAIDDIRGLLIDVMA